MQSITTKPRCEITFPSMEKVDQNMMEMMEMVKTNPKFIDQANCMIQIADRLIDSRKTQIDAAKVMVDLYKQGRIDVMVPELV